MTAGGVNYCIDTSGWLDGWRRYYPIATFKSVWVEVEQLILAGRVSWPEEVSIEILDTDLKHWLKPHASNEITTATLWNSAQQIQQQFNPDLHSKGINGADAFVIAAAQAGALCVVTGEVPGQGRPKIPNICDTLGITTFTFLGMIQNEGWTF